MRGLHLALVITVDPVTGTCGVELSEGSQPTAAHVMSPNANQSTGWIWLPQVGDMVVVGFLDGNSSMPLILGSLYAANDTLHGQNAGEMTLKHQSGSKMVIANDGTVTLTGKAGAFLRMAVNGDVELKHATSNADVTMDTNGVTISQGTVFAQIKNAEVLLDANSSGGGAKVELFPSGLINITPGAASLINLAGGGAFVVREGDVTSSPIGGPVADHFHTVFATSVKVNAG